MLNQPLHNCCMISRRREEPMIGSVKATETWLLLQYEGALGAQALEESDIPQGVKAHLHAATESLPGVRALLIKSQVAGLDGKITFILASGREVDPYYVKYELEDYDDLLALDLPDLIERGLQPVGEMADEPFYLVCTNGRRDPCCAQSGIPVFNTLQELAPGQVWECSHVGGHRFAANVLAFPHGIFYGRVNPDEAGDLLSSGENGDLLIERYRGRACFEKPVQAAEARLREKTGVLGLEDYLLDGVELLAEDSWNVTFREARTGRRHVLSIEKNISDEVDYVSCRDDQQSPVIRYQLVSYSVDQEPG